MFIDSVVVQADGVLLPKQLMQRMVEVLLGDALLHELNADAGGCPPVLPPPGPGKGLCKLPVALKPL